MRQWRRWCLSPDYLLGDEPAARPAYASATFPVLGLTFADDELLLESGALMVHEAYRNNANDVTFHPRCTNLMCKSPHNKETP